MSYLCFILVPKALLNAFLLWLLCSFVVACLLIPADPDFKPVGKRLVLAGACGIPLAYFFLS